MPSIRPFVSVAVLAVSIFFSAVAQAHPKLVTSDPQANAQVATPEKIELRFSESLVAQFSGAKLLMTGMAGMTHEPMTVAAQVSSSSDPKIMVIAPAKALTRGNYRVEWRAVSSDTHPITGNFNFSVK